MKPNDRVDFFLQVAMCVVAAMAVLALTGLLAWLIRFAPLWAL